MHTANLVSWNQNYTMVLKAKLVSWDQNIPQCLMQS